MATNIKQNETDVVNLIMPYQRNSGQGVLVGNIFGVALVTTASGVEGPVLTTAIWTAPKLAGAAWAQGARVYWDDTLKQCDTTATSDFCIGCAAVAALSGDTTGDVLLMRNPLVGT